jgi:hypothetical protein
MRDCDESSLSSKFELIQHLPVPWRRTISDAPGLAKQVSSPASVSASNNACAPFIVVFSSCLASELKGEAPPAKLPVVSSLIHFE